MGSKRRILLSLLVISVTLSGIARAENLIPETVSVKAGEKPSDKDDQDIKINYSSEPKTPLSQEDIERALI